MRMVYMTNRKVSAATVTVGGCVTRSEFRVTLEGRPFLSLFLVNTLTMLSRLSGTNGKGKLERGREEGVSTALFIYMIIKKFKRTKNTGINANRVHLSLE